MSEQAGKQEYKPNGQLATQQFERVESLRSEDHVRSLKVCMSHQVHGIVCLSMCGVLHAVQPLTACCS